MSRARILNQVAIERTARLEQLESMFQLPQATVSEQSWEVNLPLEDRPWNIGLIVGPSGSGKSSIARQLFGQDLIDRFDWPAAQSIVDAFPRTMGIKEITGLLSSVGFSSPPAWLRPFRALSNGEQFRVHLARALAERRELVAIDEFSSVVDRTVAQVGSAAVARTVRARGQKFVAVACHYDILEWLQPDWVYQPHLDAFEWRLLQRRSSIDIRISPVDRSTWRLFRHHHYLDSNLHKSSSCYCAFWNGRPVAFVAVISFPHAQRPGYRAHRVVCLPDYQGVGIGSRVGDLVAAAYTATGKPYFLTSGHPGVLGHLGRSKDWAIRIQPRLNRLWSDEKGGKSVERNRLITTFEYVGPPAPDAARKLGIL